MWFIHGNHPGLTQKFCLTFDCHFYTMIQTVPSMTAVSRLWFKCLNQVFSGLQEYFYITKVRNTNCTVLETACTFLSPRALQAVNHEVYLPTQQHKQWDTRCLKHLHTTAEACTWFADVTTVWKKHFLEAHLDSDTGNEQYLVLLKMVGLILQKDCGAHTQVELAACAAFWKTPGLWRYSHTSRTGHMCSLLKDSRALEILTHK